jgi:hypothetical protein
MVFGGEGGDSRARLPSKKGPARARHTEPERRLSSRGPTMQRCEGVVVRDRDEWVGEDRGGWVGG